MQSFIVRIWTEGPPRGAGERTWRGHVTRVPGGEQRYVTDLDDVVDFITRFLTEMGLTLGSHRQEENDGTGGPR
jgi:hypothetical protein